MPARIRPLKRGELITQSWLHDVSRTINELTERMMRLEGRVGSLGEALDGQNQFSGQTISALNGGGSMPTSLTWNKSSESTASRQGTDSGGDTENYDIATQIVATASHGGTTYQWTWNLPT